jgi:4-amino-4-deoxychorismate lyase
MRPEALREADEVLICNALMPLVPVRRWDENAGPRASFTIF